MSTGQLDKAFCSSISERNEVINLLKVSLYKRYNRLCPHGKRILEKCLHIPGGQGILNLVAKTDATQTTHSNYAYGTRREFS